ncbi:MAG: TonB family protein [Deltaproteobacteria bacterium]|nr:TonB family protein [Deltaproteobacteria bacterium]
MHLPGSVGWLAERGLERGDGTPVSLPPAVGASALPPVPAGVGGPTDGRPDPQAAVQSILADLQSADRVRTPHSYWSGVRARLEEGFSPGWEILETGPGAERGLVSGKAVGDAVRQYLAGAQRYGRAGNPHGEGAVGAGNRAESLRRMTSRLPEEAEGLLEEARPGNSLFHQELEVLVRVAQAADGRVERVELVQGSGNRAYDRLALARAQALGEEAETRLGPPPAQGRETVWAFRTSFDRVPPLPVVGLTFDAYFRPESFLYPLKASASSRVELRAIR